MVKLSEPHTHELAALTSSLAGEDPVICSYLTDVSLHSSVFSNLSKSTLEQHMQQNNKISGLYKIKAFADAII